MRDKDQQCILGNYILYQWFIDTGLQDNQRNPCQYIVGIPPAPSLLLGRTSSTAFLSRSGRSLWSNNEQRNIQWLSKLPPSFFKNMQERMSPWRPYRIGPGKQRQCHPVCPSSLSCCEGGLSLRGFPSGWIASSFLFWRSRSSGPYLLPTWEQPECQSLLDLVVVQSPVPWSAALHQKPSNSGLQREWWV